MSTLTSLKQGQKGPQVKKLQEDLIERGLLEKGMNTGFYGPLTAAAIQKYNSSAGMHPTNTSVGVSDYLDSHPNLKGTKTGDYLQKLKVSNPELYRTIADSAKNGHNFTPDMFASASSAATDALDPYYNQEAKNSSGILQNYLDQTTGQYNQDEASLKDAASTAFDNFNFEEDKGGMRGNARDRRMKSLESTYNDKFNNLYRNNASDIASKLQSNEYNYGTAPVVNLNKTNTTFGTSMPNYSSTSSSVYNPFNFAGRKNSEKSANLLDFTNKGVSGMFNPLAVKTNN